MKKLFGKDEPEDLTDRDLQKIIARLMDDRTFVTSMVDVVRVVFMRDINTRQIVADKVNSYLDELFIDEDNRMKIKEAVIRQIDELHNVKILLDRIPHNEADHDE